MYINIEYQQFRLTEKGKRYTDEIFINKIDDEIYVYSMDISKYYVKLIDPLIIGKEYMEILFPKSIIINVSFINDIITVKIQDRPLNMRNKSIYDIRFS